MHRQTQLLMQRAAERDQFDSACYVLLWSAAYMVSRGASSFFQVVHVCAHGEFVGGDHVKRICMRYSLLTDSAWSVVCCTPRAATECF